jgi:amidase
LCENFLLHSTRVPFDPFCSALSLAAQIRRREISPVEVIEAYLSRIDRLNPALNAFVQLDEEGALAAARMAEKAVMRANALGPLHGVPFSTKTSVETERMCFDVGSRLRSGLVGKSNAPIVQRLKAAGAILLGVTNVPELLMAWETDNLLHGRTNSPYDHERTPGGSSGGEAAAIAAGLTALGIGSDGGGSIRVPAHFSGICGLKPTPGRIPITGHFPPSGGPFAFTGAVGPMARTAADLRAMFDVMAGFDDGDPSATPVSVHHPTADQVSCVTIGVVDQAPGFPVAPEIREAVWNVADVLHQEHFITQEYRPDWFPEGRRAWWTFFGQAGGVVLGPMLQGREHELSPILQQFRSYVTASPPLDDHAFLRAWLERDGLRLRVLAEMRHHRVLLLPACSIPAFRHGERNWVIEGHAVTYVNDMPESPDVMIYSEIFNVLGFPAAVVPVGRTRDGLPVGVQIVGRPFEDEMVLALAALIDRNIGFTPPADVT